MSIKSRLLWLFIYIPSIFASTSITNVDTFHKNVIEDIYTHYKSKDVSKIPSNLEYDKSKEAWYFLNGLSNSPTFVKEYWHKRPLLIRANKVTSGWIPGLFTIENDLKLIENSYISGSRTGDALRTTNDSSDCKVIKADSTWSFAPLKKDQTKKTNWNEVEESLKGGTIYFNTAGSLWPNLGKE